MIITKFYSLKSGKKEKFLTNVKKSYDNQEDIASFTQSRPHFFPYHIKDTTVFINNYKGSRNPFVATITACGETEKNLEEKVRDAKTLLEELGKEELIERDVLSGE